MDSQKLSRSTVAVALRILIAALCLCSAPRVGHAQEASTEDCVPDCRDGYVCHAGACISACNPPCDEGQVCTGKGTCVAPDAASGTAGSDDAAGSNDAEDDHFGRFRWGVSAYGALFFGEGTGAGVGGAFRFGSQISRLVAVYGQPLGLVGGVDSRSMVLSGAEALVDFTISDRVYLALGPGLLAGSFEVGIVGGSSSPLFFSGVTRAGVYFGSMKPHRRRAFHAGLDTRVIFGSDGAYVAPILALGYESF